jgi:two-component system sensor histidine kinase RpfC
MRIPLMTVALKRENDLLLARQRARQISQLLGFSTGDSPRITTAVAEIARNAVTYGRGGSLTFFIEDEPDASQRFVMLITDDGPGVPLEARSRIFDKFETLAARREQRYHSAGLGLAFCKLAVEAHGGRIGVEDAVPQGSIFWFDLPY